MGDVWERPLCPYRGRQRKTPAGNACREKKRLEWSTGVGPAKSSGGGSDQKNGETKTTMGIRHTTRGVGGGGGTSELNLGT